MLVSPLGSDGERDSDRIDVGAVALPKQVCAELSHHYVPLGVRDVDADDVFDPTTQYFFAGYPESKIRIQHEAKAIIPKLYVLGAPALMPEEIEAAGFDFRTHVLIELEGDKYRNLSGLRSKPPKVAGMSGGGVFKLIQHCAVFQLQLVGIIIELGRRPRRSLVATRIAFALEAAKLLCQKAIGDFPECRRLRFRYAGAPF